jgi:hypothetical protein
LVSSLRASKTQCIILSDWQYGIWLWRDSSFWSPADERDIWFIGLEMDIHCSFISSIVLLRVHLTLLQIEGVLTCLLGIGSYFVIVDFPEASPKSWRFLNEAEAAFIVARIQNDRSDTFPEPFSVKSYLRHALDSKVWAFAFLLMMTTTCSYSIAYFLPIILRDGMGFSVAEAQCLTAPPYVAAAIVMFIQAYFADKWRVRGPMIVGNALMGTTTILRFLFC